MREIVSRHESDLVRYAWHLVGDQAEAQEVVVRSFVRVLGAWAGAGSETAPGRLELFRAVSDEAGRCCRGARGGGCWRSDDGSDAGVGGWLAGLSFEERNLVVLRVLLKVPAREVAVILGMDEPAMGLLLCRLLRRKIDTVGKTGQT